MSYTRHGSEESLSIDNTNSERFKTTISNILSNHLSEIKLATDGIMQPINGTNSNTSNTSNISKKKLKELITKHTNDIFGFMANNEKTPLILTETIFRKYGRDIPTIKGYNTGSTLKDLNLDISMSDITQFFDDELKKNSIDATNTTNVTNATNKKDTFNIFLRQTEWVFNQYKIIGEEVLRLEHILFQKIEILDKLNSRSQMLTSLSDNEVLPELINTFSKYAESVYKSTNIEDSYKELVLLYKKWNICRQIIVLSSNFKNEPQCSICLTEPVITAIVPCGHTFCGNCIKKQNTSCYICRGTIRERIKLYFT